MTIAILCLLSLIPLWSFEIWENGKLMMHYPASELEAYSFVSEKGKTLPLSDILPIYAELREIEVFSADGILNLKEASTIKQSLLVFTEDSVMFQAGPHRFSNPDGIRVYGEMEENSHLYIWIPESERFLEEELELFARNHRLELHLTVQDDIPRALAKAHLQNGVIPDLVLFEHRDMLFTAPYLQPNPWEIAPGVLDIALAEGQGAMSIPLYYRLHQWDSNSSQAEEMVQSFLFLNRHMGLSYRELLESLAASGGFEAGKLTEIRISTLGIPLHGSPGPTEETLFSYLTREKRIGEILNQREGIYSREDALEEDLSAGIPGYTWEYLILQNKLLHILPQVRSGIIDIEQAMELLE